MNARDRLAADISSATDHWACPIRFREAEFIAIELEEKGYRKSRTITTREEVDDLMEGAIIIDACGDVSQLRSGHWCSYETRPMESRMVAKWLPATVLHEGEK
jgi:hypothetical protein